jgi:UrcA family protein
MTMDSFKKTRVVSTACIALTIAALIAATPSTAAAQDTTPDARWTQNVKYDDLNLDTEKGASVLLARLRQAAQVVCKSLENPHGLEFRNHWQVCYDRALASAVGQINKAQLSAAYRASLAPKDKG